jgi:sirohydrochlorin ferrochelatase
MPEVLIVAHGAPANPAPQEARLQALAAQVGALLPGWQVRGATLATEGALRAALAGMTAPIIYPFFMTEGWFTDAALPRALARAGVQARQLSPFGADPALPGVMASAAVKAAILAGLEPESSALLIAAHGSGASRKPRESAMAFAESLRRLTPFSRIVLGFLDEEPKLASAAGGLGPALCLPYFALRAGHVEHDIPLALAQAGFTGPLLAAVGEHPGVPALITAALTKDV